MCIRDSACLVAGGGQKDDRDRLRFPDLRADGKPVSIRQGDINQRQIEGMLIQNSHGFLPRGRMNEVKPLGAEQKRQVFGNGRVIFDKEQPFHPSFPLYKRRSSFLPLRGEKSVLAFYQRRDVFSLPGRELVCRRPEGML